MTRIARIMRQWSEKLRPRLYTESFIKPVLGERKSSADTEQSVKKTYGDA